MALAEPLPASEDVTPVANMRRHMRFAPAPEAPPLRFYYNTGGSCMGTLLNESFSGIAALVASADAMQLGEVISVEYFGKPMPGIIRRIAAEGERWLVAVEWQ
jgi:hypothetical protein